jgi:hypothetical protein
VTYRALRSLFVLTVTGVPRSEPLRPAPYGRMVSPERELHELSTDPWRPTVSFRVMITKAGRAAQYRDGARDVGGRVGGGLLAQKGLGRLLH